MALLFLSLLRRRQEEDEIWALIDELTGLAATEEA